MDVEKYKAALEAHKHYDTVSIAIVGGQLAISGASFFIYEKIEGTPVDYLPFVITALCILILLSLYRHCAYFANVARNVAADLEQGKEIPGVSVAFKTNSHPANKSWRRGIYGKVHFLSFILVAGLVASAVVVLNK